MSDENKIEEAKNSSTPYDDTEVKTDINNIKTDLGTEELTTTSKEIKGAINNLNSQIKEIDTQTQKITNNNIKFKDILRYNDMKPSLYYHDGMIDTDVDIEDDIPNRDKLKPIFDQGAINIYYKQKQYTKTVVYYQENSRIASKDFFFSEQEIKEAKTLADLGIDANLYQSDEFKPGIVMSDETIIASDDVAAFINAPSPIVVYKKWSKEERPDLFYYEYYRGGAYEEEGKETITVNSDNANYLDCDLTATVLNPNGLIKYVDHYHDALYEDEKQT